MRDSLLWLSCFALIFLISGCSPPAGNAPAKGNSATGKKLRIGVIPKGLTHEFWKSVHFGAQQAAEKYGAEIIWLGPQTENDLQSQIKIVQNFVNKEVDGICVAPLDSRGMVTCISEAHAAKIPVVVFDSGLDDESVIVSYVATDNFLGGKLAGQEMARRLQGKGKVILLRYKEGSESTHQREEGFLAALKEHPEIEILVSNQYAGTSPDEARKKAQQLLQKYHDQVQGIFAVCEPNANGTLLALTDEKLNEQVTFIAFDPSPPLVSGLADKSVEGIVLQDPVKMGYVAVETMILHLQGKKVEKRISTGEYLATPENRNDEKMKKLLEPPIVKD